MHLDVRALGKVLPNHIFDSLIIFICFTIDLWASVEIECHPKTCRKMSLDSRDPSKSHENGNCQ